MSQKEKLQQLLAELGIPYRERVWKPNVYPSEDGVAGVSEWETSIDLPEGKGLPGMVTSFYFGPEEAFLGHRVWKEA